MKLNYSESHPLKSHEINEQLLTKAEFLEQFERFEWEKLLELQLNADANQIHFSPSINLDDNDGKSVAVSIVGGLDDYEFYVCYKRPTIRKKSKWLGFVKYDYLDNDFCSVIPQQTKKDALNAFLLFYDRDFEELEERWG